MNKARILLKYIAPYKWSAFKNIFYNMLSAVFALVSYTLVIPFLKILFNTVQQLPPPGQFRFSIDYLNTAINYGFYEFIHRHGEVNALLLVCIVVVIASLLKNGFVFLANNSMAYMRSCTVRDLRKKMYDKILRLPLSYFSDARKGDVMTRISNDVQEVEISVMASLTMMFRDPLYMLIFLIYLFATSYQLMLFAMLLLPLSGWLIGKTSKTLRSSSYLGQQHLGRLLSVVEETLSGLRIIKGFNAETRMRRQFGETNERYAKVFKRVTRKAYLASPLSEFLSTIVLMIILYFGSTLALRGIGSMGQERLIAFVVVFSQIIPPAKNITTAWFNIQKGMASIERIDQIIDAEEKIVEKDNAVEVTEFRDSIEFRGVWYAYNTEPVLRDINLKILKGQTVAIVGRSGAGKSTLADLLPRFMDVDQGSILIDGTDIRDFRIKSLRSLMGIVSQQSILFNATFTENIAFGMESPDFEKVREAAEIANADGFIMESENGYDYYVGEGGNKLSGGQKQRVSIARAIMANPPILILDEATSALDTESERLVQDAMLKLMKNRTSIVIAHRLSTIQHADLIVVMDDGKITETGTHTELLKKDEGYYKKLHGFQAL